MPDFHWSRAHSFTSCAQSPCRVQLGWTIFDRAARVACQLPQTRHYSGFGPCLSRVARLGKRVSAMCMLEPTAALVRDANDWRRRCDRRHARHAIESVLKVQARPQRDDV